MYRFNVIKMLSTVYNCVSLMHSAKQKPVITNKRYKIGNQYIPISSRKPSIRKGFIERNLLHALIS